MSSMRCPKCGGRGYVKDSRETRDAAPISSYAGSVYRRRACLDCSHRWSTREINQDEVDALQERAGATEGLRRALEVYINATMPPEPTKETR